MAEQDIGVRVGDLGALSTVVTQEKVEQFARFCGDVHPMHFPGEYPRQTRFGRPVAHGVTALALISAVLGTKIGSPVVTVVQLGQTARFLRPVYPGDTITATCTVTQVNPERRIAILECRCVNQDGQEVLTGEATVKVDPMPYTPQKRQATRGRAEA